MCDKNTHQSGVKLLVCRAQPRLAGVQLAQCNVELSQQLILCRLRDTSTALCGCFIQCQRASSMLEHTCDSQRARETERQRDRGRRGSVPNPTGGLM